MMVVLVMGFMLVFCTKLTCSDQLQSRSDLVVDRFPNEDFTLEYFKSPSEKQSSFIRALQPRTTFIITIINAATSLVTKVLLMPLYLIYYVYAGIRAVIALILRLIINGILYMVAVARLILDKITALLHAILEIIAKFAL